MAFRKIIKPLISFALLAALAALLALYCFVSNGNVPEWFYMNKKDHPKTVGMPEVAVAIIHEANIKFNDYFDEAFIYSAEDNLVTILYKSYDPIQDHYYHFVDIDTGDVDALTFVETYFTDDAFRKGYNTIIEWEYEKENNTFYRAYLTLDDNVEDSIGDYEKMRERDLVIDDGAFVAVLGSKIPLPTNESFFVLDKSTRLSGWYYFKTHFNGKDFVACFEVSGWDIDTTFEDLINGYGFYVEDVSSTRILVADRDQSEQLS